MSTLGRRLAVANRGLEGFLFTTCLCLHRASRQTSGVLASKFLLHVGLYEGADAVALLASVEDDAGGSFAVAAAAAGFLDEGLEAAGQAVVNDEADVGGVDAHAEGSCSDDDVECVGFGG